MYYIPLGETVPGGGHKNQDAMGINFHKGACPVSKIAESDGHGDPRHFRSQVGACLAVQAFDLATCNKLAFVTESDVKQEANNLPGEISRLWRHVVAQDVFRRPFRAEEQKFLLQSNSAVQFDEIILNPITAYGATLAGVITTKHHIIYLKIGDGDILVVDSAGQVDRPFEDSSQIGEQTDSLCMADAAGRFNVKVVPLAESMPRLIMVSSDGYSKSFISEADFRKAASDMIKNIDQYGITYVVKNLRTWLATTSSKGSCDDTTCAMLVRVDDKEAAKVVPTEGVL